MMDVIKMKKINCDVVVVGTQKSKILALKNFVFGMSLKIGDFWDPTPKASGPPTSLVSTRRRRALSLGWIRCWWGDLYKIEEEIYMMRWQV
jgi:hypothetical protein